MQYEQIRAELALEARRHRASLLAGRACLRGEKYIATVRQQVVIRPHKPDPDWDAFVAACGDRPC